MTRADKVDSFDIEDQEAVEERRLLQYPAVLMAEEEGNS